MPNPTDTKVLADLPILVRGAGVIGTAVARRLHAAGLTRVALTELSAPRTTHAANTFAGAVAQGNSEVEGLRAKWAEFFFEFVNTWGDGMVPVHVDPRAEVKARMLPTVIVDATGAPDETLPDLLDCPMTVGIGPGFPPDKVSARVVLGGPANGRLVLPKFPEWAIEDRPQELPPPTDAGIPSWARAVAGGVLEAVIAFYNWNLEYKGYPRRLGSEM